MFPSANPTAFFHLSGSPGGARVLSARAPRSPQNQALWWTVEEVAAELRVHEQSVRRWIKLGTLTAKRVGTQIRIHRFAVTAMLDRNPLGPQPEKRRRGGQLKSSPPAGILKMYRDREEGYGG